jgi:hypothetical protein
VPDPPLLLRARLLRPAVALVLLAGVLALGWSVARGAELPPADFVMNNGAEVTSFDPATATGQPEGRVL